MSTHEHNALQQYRDASGDMHIIYPVTKAENVLDPENLLAGNSERLGGETSEEWRLRTNQTLDASLSEAGWYRVASYTRMNGLFVLSLYNNYRSGGSDAISLLYLGAHGKGKFILLGSSHAKDAIFSKVRVVYTGDGVAVDVYYTKNVTNACFVSLQRLLLDWSLTDSITLVTNEPTEEDTVVSYDIPKEARVVLDTELDDFIKNTNSATQTVKSAHGSSAPLGVDSTHATGTSVYVQYSLRGENQGKMGFANGIPWVATKGAIHGDWNSSKVVFTASDTAAPADGDALWAHL